MSTTPRPWRAEPETISTSSAWWILDQAGNRIAKVAGGIGRNAACFLATLRLRLIIAVAFWDCIE